MPRSRALISAKPERRRAPADDLPPGAPAGDASSVTARSFPSLASAVEALFAASSPPPDWFADTFLTRVPVGQVSGLFSDLVARGGRPVAMAGEGERVEVTLERGRVEVEGALDEDGRVA